MNRPSVTSFVTCALGATAALTLASCGNGSSTKPRSAPAVPVLLAKVEQRTMPLAVRAVGHVEPIESVAVRPQVGGVLQEVHFSEGQKVLKGQVIFTIDPRPYQAALRESEARLARDQAMLRKAEADVTRYGDLVRRDFVTKEQFDSIATNAESQRAVVAADTAVLDNVKLQLAYCTVTAPLSGRTGNLMVKVGNLVKANDDKPLVTINQTQGVFVSFAVPAEYLPGVRGKAGDGLKVNALLPGEDGAESGSLVMIDNAVDTATGTILLKARFDNPDERLWPGQFVDTELVLEQQANRLVVSSAAVLTGQQGTYVWVVKDGAADLRLVKVARQDELETVLDSGVQPGETVVTDGQLRLVAGARVEAKNGLAETSGGRP